MSLILNFRIYYPWPCHNKLEHVTQYFLLLYITQYEGVYMYSKLNIYTYIRIYTYCYIIDYKFIEQKNFDNQMREVEKYQTTSLQEKQT